MATRQIPWLRVLIEGVVIVASILMAFGIDAWWDERQDRAEERRLLADLAAEFEENRDRLESTTSRHRVRVARLGTLIREAGPDAEGLGPDSLNALARLVLVNPTFRAERGVMEHALSGDGLRVIREPELRTGATITTVFSSYSSENGVR